MVNIVPVSTSRHAGKAWRRPASFVFASTQTVVPLTGAEFAKAALAMPIAFIEQAGQYLAVGVMSLVSDQNLFVGPAGQWLGTYVPATLRSYPFRLGRVEGAEEFHLCIDEDSGLVVEADGTAEDFVDASGSPAPATKAIFDFLVAVERGRAMTATAVAVLADTGLIEPWPLQVTVDGTTTPVRGFFRINEAALNALDDAVFLKLRKLGALPLAYLQLVSMGQISIFSQLSLAQRQLAQTQQQPRAISSLDEIFENTTQETLRFH